MARILGHLPGALEQRFARMLSLMGVPQQNSRAPQIAAKAAGPRAQTRVVIQSRAVSTMSRLAPSVTPLQSRSMMAPSEEAKAHGKVAATAGSPVEKIVLEQLDLAGITDLNERAMFMAQMSHESNGFKRLTENLNYKPARLLAIFPSKFDSLEDAQAVVGGGQSAIAERVYGNRQSLGNVHPGDGYRYRGRGIVQLTGRTNYRRAGQAIGVDLEADPDKAAILDVAVKAALWFWKDKDIGRHARQGNVEKVTLLINGGKIGLADRKREYAEWQRRLSLPVVSPKSPTAPVLRTGPLP